MATCSLMPLSILWLRFAISGIQGGTTLENPKSNMPTLAARLRDAGAAKSNYHALYSLFLEDYFKGLDELTGFDGHFTSVYKKYFQFYDMESVVLLAEMTDKAANFVPKKKAELLNLLFIQPFYYIAHIERS